MSRSITIESHVIGPDHRPFIVAEMSGNHNGELERALRIVDVAADAGAHALKLQTYTADTITLNSRRPEFVMHKDHSLIGGVSLYELYSQYYTPWEWHEPIFTKARERGMVAFSAPFDLTAVEFLETLDVPAYKIASLELVDLPLIRLAASKGKPMIMSTGAASVKDIAAAVETARDAGCEEILLMACTSEYPANASNSNLRKLPLLADMFDVPVGFSDHTFGLGASLASVAMGASMLEKHVTTLREDGGVDSSFSLDASDLPLLVAESERAWQALGEARIGVMPDEEPMLGWRRSLYVTRDVKAGEKVSPDNVRSVRPANGLAPAYLDLLDGKVFARDVEFATPTSWDMFTDA